MSETKEGNKKKGASENGTQARSQNIPADIVEEVESIRDSMGRDEVAQPSFSKIVLAAIRAGLPKIAEQCKPPSPAEKQRKVRHEDSKPA